MLNEILAYVSPSVPGYFSGIALTAALSVIGASVGILAGLFGVGGGFLLVPLMNVLLGIPIDLAAGSATCYIIGASASGIVRHWKRRNIEISAAVLLSAGSIFGALTGDFLQDFIIHTLAGGNREMFEKIMQGLFVVILFVIAWIMYKNPGERKGGKTVLQKLSFGPSVTLRVSGQEGVNAAGLFLIGFSGGVLTGLMGVSGGVLFLPILVLGVGLLPHLAVGTSLTVVFVSSLTAVLKKGLSSPDKVSLPVAVSLLVAGTIGVRLGMIISGKISGSALKRYFSIIALSAAVMVLVKLFF